MKKNWKKVLFALMVGMGMAQGASARIADGCYFLWGEGDEPVGYMCCRGGGCNINWF